jgi:hypothetical protein
MQSASQQIGQPIGMTEMLAMRQDEAVRAQLFAGAALDNETDRIGV